jgi:hypothetical protein
MGKETGYVFALIFLNPKGPGILWYRGGRRGRASVEREKRSMVMM